MVVVVVGGGGVGGGQRVPVGHPLDQIKPGRLGAIHTEWFRSAWLYFFSFFFSFVKLPTLEPS